MSAVTSSEGALSGTVGTVTTSRTNSHLVWNVGDRHDVRSTQTRAKISATGDGLATLIVHLPGGVPLEMVLVPAGSFIMGSVDPGWSRSDEEPTHTVDINYAFYMGKYEVTQRQWLAVMGAGADRWDAANGKGDKYPAYNVSWNEIAAADGFLDRLNQHIAVTGQGPASHRLPSESEWEYACRAGSTSRFFIRQLRLQR